MAPDDMKWMIQFIQKMRSLGATRVEVNGCVVEWSDLSLPFSEKEEPEKERTKEEIENDELRDLLGSTEEPLHG